MPSAFALRCELSARAQQMAAQFPRAAHQLTLGEVPSVIFQQSQSGEHANFHPRSYRNVLSNRTWLRRMAKVHTSGSKAQSPRWMELDSATSSDALLMNIFCYSRTLRNRALCAMLGVPAGHTAEFGFRPRIPLRDGKLDRTEIDMKLGTLLVEAKLTESDFQMAPRRLVKRYQHLDEVFDCRRIASGDRIPGYQLIRGVLAAHATGGTFCVLCDARRPDLVETWYAVMSAVRSCAVRCRLQLLTWQEVARLLPQTLQRFLAVKYGINDPVTKLS